MSINDMLGQRMKTYEAVAQHYLMKRTPVIIRVDMKAGHTFTKHLNKPWDNIFQSAMQNTMKFMCENIQNAKFGYCQSDEITIVLTDYETLLTDAWFSYRTDKLCSISASMATMKFNQEFNRMAQEEIFTYQTSMVPQSMEIQLEMKKYHDALRACMLKGAMFDARCFNIPKEEVTNLVYWRQIDAVRNSIQSHGQAKFSHKEMMNKNTKQVKEMLEKIGYNWETIPICCQRGVACVKTEDGWQIDKTMPLLKGEDRAYLDDLIF